MRLNHQRTGATGLVYDGVDLTEHLQLVEIEMPLLPVVDAVTHELAQRPGAYFALRKVGTREIKATLRLDAQSRDPFDIFEAWSMLAGLLNKKEPKKLHLGGKRWCNALMVGQSKIDDEAYYGVVEVTFVCFDPYLYGEEREVALSAGTAKEFDVTCPEDVFPVFELTASSTSVTVTNMVSGEIVTVPGLTTGAALTVDMGRQCAMVGGAYVPVNLASDFFSVEGKAKVKVANASGTLKYVERFL